MGVVECGNVMVDVSGAVTINLPIAAPHDFSSISLPTQSPAQTELERMHFRRLIVTPSPQLLEQALQLPKAPQELTE